MKHTLTQEIPSRLANGKRSVPRCQIATSAVVITIGITLGIVGCKEDRLTTLQREHELNSSITCGADGHLVPCNYDFNTCEDNCHELYPNRPHDRQNCLTECQRCKEVVSWSQDMAQLSEEVLVGDALLYPSLRPLYNCYHSCGYFPPPQEAQSEDDVPKPPACWNLPGHDAGFSINSPRRINLELHVTAGKVIDSTGFLGRQEFDVEVSGPDAKFLLDREGFAIGYQEPIRPKRLLLMYCISTHEGVCHPVQAMEQIPTEDQRVSKHRVTTPYFKPEEYPIHMELFSIMSSNRWDRLATSNDVDHKEVEPQDSKPQAKVEARSTNQPTPEPSSVTDAPDPEGGTQSLTNAEGKIRGVGFLRGLGGNPEVPDPLREKSPELAAIADRMNAPPAAPAAKQIGDRRVLHIKSRADLPPISEKARRQAEINSDEAYRRKESP